LVNSTEKEQQPCSIKRGDVFLTRTSETDEELGMNSVALKDYPNATFNGFTKPLRPKGDVEILPEYAGFYNSLIYNIESLKLHITYYRFRIKRKRICIKTKMASYSLKPTIT